MVVRSWVIDKQAKKMQPAQVVVGEASPAVAQLVGVFVWCLKKEGGPGAVPPGKFFIFLPKTMGFYKILCARKITKQKNRCRMRN